MEILELISKHEGFRHYPYYDSTGHLTIGVGRNIQDRGISKDEALYMLKNDIADFKQQLSAGLFWFDSAPDTVKDVLTDMCFNLGYFGLMKFRNTLEHLKNGAYKLAAEDMLHSTWAKQVGARATELAEILKSLK